MFQYEREIHFVSLVNTKRNQNDGEGFCLCASKIFGKLTEETVNFSNVSFGPVDPLPLG
jgi:hypothetical protein